MVQVARSRNHQTQNTQRPQQRENSWSTSPRASPAQRAGEKLGPTTNSCWSSGPDGRFAAKVLSLSGTGTEAPAVIEVLKISERGVAKVATKDGTVKLGLPCVA